jgi:aryl-alcohol dehydrogenase-like predicted oxidoreductase
MTFFNIPKTEIKVSRVILGCWAFAGGDYWGNQEEKESVKTIHAALDRGINALDTALAYGRWYF